MTFTMDDYDPPLDGHLDTRRLAMFADNLGLKRGFASERTALGLKVYVTVGDKEFIAEDADGQAALDAATDLAIAAFS